jgi:hypothetical protein
MRKASDWKRSRISVLEVEAVPQIADNELRWTCEQLFLPYFKAFRAALEMYRV